MTIANIPSIYISGAKKPVKEVIAIKASKPIMIHRTVQNLGLFFFFVSTGATSTPVPRRRLLLIF